MADQLQLRGGTTTEHNTFTGASKEVTVDTTKKTAVVHDGATAGGNPLMREDGANSALSLGSQGTPSLKFTGDTNTGIYSPGADQVAISTGGQGRLFIDASGNVLVNTSTTPTAPIKLLVSGNAGVNSGSYLSFRGEFGNTSEPAAHAIKYDSTLTGLQYYGYGGHAYFAGGSERLRITATGELKHIGGGSVGSPAVYFAGSAPSNSLYVQNTTGNVGLGTNNPTHDLTIGSTAASDFVLALRGGVGGFLGWDDSANCTILQAPNTRSLQFRVNSDTFSAGTMAMHINSSGNVGIGTTSPSNFLHIKNDTIANTYAIVENTTVGNAGINLKNASGDWQIVANANLRFIQTGTGDRVNIDSDGRLLVGTTTASTNNTSIVFRAAGNVQVGSAASIGRSGGDYDGIGYNVAFTGTSNTYNYVVSDTAAFIKFGSGGGRVETFTAAAGTGGNSISFTAGPYVAQGGTSWTSSSDERLKEDLSPIENGLTKVNSLRAVTGRFKTDNLSKRRSFLIAQDVQEVLPEAVDTVDPESLGLDYVAVIPLLVAALKESKQRIETLEQRLSDAGIA